MLKIIDSCTIEGVVPPSDCEKNFNVKWLSGTPTGSFYIGDSNEEKKKIAAFISGKQRCKVDTEAFFKYIADLEEIVRKYKNMFYGPIGVLQEIKTHFKELKEDERVIYISYQYPDRYLKTSKFDPNVREFKFSLASYITNVKFVKNNGEYTVFVNIVDNWREVLMQGKCNNDALIEIFNEYIKEQEQNGYCIEDAARLFGIKYAPLIRNNSISVDAVVKGSNYAQNNLVELVKNGISISDAILWETKGGYEYDTNEAEEGGATPYLYDTSKGGAQNKVIYGTPGCGKSYYVQNRYLNEIGVAEKNRIRTTFYQDYTNIDFVGQILPKVHEDKTVTYEFNPGPFALALKMAIENQDKPVALIIEELNRGNAASIFGDIFQLLDRDKNGRSQYAITNTNLQDYLNGCFEEELVVFNDIRIPANLYIVATMNTSDQNVFTLDTAFKRRWQFEKLRNQFTAEHEYQDYYVPGMQDVTWKQLVNAVNNFIVTGSDDLSAEDKQLGVYFVGKEVLCELKEDCTDKAKMKSFAYKVFEYLWDDVAKFAHPDWFGTEIKTLDQLIDAFVEEGKQVLANVLK